MRVSENHVLKVLSVFRKVKVTLSLCNMLRSYLELTLPHANGVIVFLNAEGHVFFSFVDIRHNVMCEQTCNARHMAMCYVMDVYELVFEDQTWRLGV